MAVSFPAWYRLSGFPAMLARDDNAAAWEKAAGTVDSEHHSSAKSRSRRPRAMAARSIKSL
jgi:hypothetical protein